MAADGYQALWTEWLPYYRSIGTESQEKRLQLTLLKIMSTLDDTCVIHRVGIERAQEVKREADEILRCAQNNKDKLTEICKRYAAEGISPGGAADMLALTILIDTLLS